MKMFVLIVYCTLFLVTAVQCFNLDVSHTIIYQDPSKSVGSRGSYFGFSLLLYAGANGTDPWIQIGAPRGNDTYTLKGVMEPGVVYRCFISQACKTVALDDKRSNIKETKYYPDDKNKAWIGGAMDIDENNDRVAVCGHRWSYFKTEDRFSYMLGVCYWSHIHHNISDTTEFIK
ncbi:hypothetical protein L9F63_003276 [Diploptera punctata]|uniref:Uncharacterized protein n=1 Tax=Diploptera punctata TaxID=6984 RepID=A0AAD7ZM28_DIPPU|nr:hypothetical protein L9F63_003276 [Diploptera punctata]